MSSTPRQEAPSLTVGGYTLLTRIGEGGMGVVHLARRPGGERVALKVLRPHIIGDDESRARLAREVGSLRRIRSPRVAEIVDADPWGPVPFVATRYVPGLSLHDHVAEEGPVTGPDLPHLAGCLAEALAAVHACGVLHRDVKPSNVLMEGRSPVLIDFGLARVADDPRLTLTGWLLGTPGYLAPEILFGEDATTASDVHSWAATVAFAASGEPPYGRGPAMAVMDRVRRGEHRLTGLPDPLRAVVDAALRTDPEARPTLPEVLATLRAPAPVPPRPPERQAPMTQPLAAAAWAAPGAVTAAVTPRPTLVQTMPPGQAPRLPQPASAPAPGHPLVEPWSLRARRGVLVVLGVLLGAAAVAAYPYLATAGLVVGAWLLRGASLAASTASERRRRRGSRWYDGAQLLLSTPWHLLRSTPGTLMLVLWAGGLAVAGALIGYAAAAPLSVTLALAGSALTGALWLGPGGSRVRSPVELLLRPVVRRTPAWVVVALVVAAVAAGIGAVAAGGPDWSPAGQGPLSSL